MICEGFGAGSQGGGTFLPLSSAFLLLLARAPCWWEGGSSHKTGLCCLMYVVNWEKWGG